MELYCFWLKFLTTHFNDKVYEEFRNVALNDARKAVPSKFGLSKLLEYFEFLLDETQTSKPWKSELQTPPSIIRLHAEEARLAELGPLPTMHQ